MTFVSIVVIAAVILGLAALSYLGKTPAAHEPITRQMLRVLIAVVLYRGVARGALAIWVRDDPRVFHLTKYTPKPATAPGPVGIRGELPSAPWSEPYRPAFRDELQRLGLAYADEPEGIVIDFGQDLESARAVIEALFTRVFAVDLEKQCVGYLNDKILPLPVPRLTGIAVPSTLD